MNEEWATIKNVNSHDLMMFEYACGSQNMLMGATSSAMMDAEDILGHLAEDLFKAGTPQVIIDRIAHLIDDIDKTRHEIIDEMSASYDEYKTALFKQNGWIPVKEEKE